MRAQFMPPIQTQSMSLAVDNNGFVSNILQVYDVSPALGVLAPTCLWNGFSRPRHTTMPPGPIYVAGGLDGSFETSTTWIYDPVANTWDSSTGAPMPVAMGGRRGGPCRPKHVSARFLARHKSELQLRHRG
jgi:hypothetical protein